MTGKLEMVVKEAADFAETLPARRLLKIEENIRKAEDDGVTFRWESGRELLPMRKGKQLPRGDRAELVKTLDVSIAELTRRMQFAETFKTKEEVFHAVEQFKSWRAIASKALPKQPRKERPVTEAKKRLRAELTFLKKLHANKLDESERALVDAIYDEVTRLTEEASQ